MNKKQYWILEGDWGGQIYLSVPVDTVEPGRVEAALCIVDTVEWTCNEGGGRSAFQKKGRPGRPIFGGMGGGFFPSGRIWTHPRLNPDLKVWVEQFIFGEVSLPTIGKVVEWLTKENVFNHRDDRQLSRLARMVQKLALGCMAKDRRVQA